MTPLLPNHRRYVMHLWEDLREANRQTRKYDQQWNKINDELNDRMDRKGETDIISRTKSKGESIPLKDAFSAGQWWRGKATWLAQAILAEEAAMRMLNPKEEP